MGSGLCECLNVLLQRGHAPFATAHTGIDLTNVPTESGRSPMKIDERLLLAVRPELSSQPANRPARF